MAVFCMSGDTCTIVVPGLFCMYLTYPHDYSMPLTCHVYIIYSFLMKPRRIVFCCIVCLLLSWPFIHRV